MLRISTKHFGWGMVRTAGLLALTILLGSGPLRTQTASFPQAGADSRTPSRSHYFDWINSQYEGTTEAQTLLNLDFFQWLHDRYGMKLDIYSLDVGNIDDGPYTAGVGRLIPYHYGSLKSREFREQFPRGFGPAAEKAASFGCRLGLWMGPDGFGVTPEEERLRKEMLITLCRDFNFHLFKLDGVAGPFREEKAGILIETLKKCREYAPDLIVSSHRIDFGAAEPFITHHLWEGEETYVDVFINNRSTAPHHRAGSLERKLTPDLNRMFEDHGVCFSSCLDYWDDELILQAFNRSLILAPQIYGNPWFLRDEEYPRFARIFNLHRKYRDILVEGIQLPESQYGPFAMSRGDGSVRLVSLRNLSWEARTYTVTLDASLGLDPSESLLVKQYHPTERILGTVPWGRSIPVLVEPFRTCLLRIGSDPESELSIYGCDYEVIREIPGEPAQIRLLGEPGLQTRIRLATGQNAFQEGTVDGKEVSLSRLQEGLDISFAGKKPENPYHRKLGDPVRTDHVPDDAEALFESTCFAADSNALEVRCLERSGPTAIPEVKACRDAFFSKSMFINRGIWDRNLFDGDMSTFFIARLENRMFRLDMGTAHSMDSIVIRIRDRQEYDLNPAMNSFAEGAFAEVSCDLVHWDRAQLDYEGMGTIARIRLDPGRPIRYLRIAGPPRRLAEIEAYSNGKAVDRSGWRASNLFGCYCSSPAVAAWELIFTVDEVRSHTYLAVALNGEHGSEGAYAALRIGGQYVGAPDRAVSFPSNTWEYFNVESDRDYTYYFPLLPEHAGKEIEVVILGLQGGAADFEPEVWITANPVPYRSVLLELR